VFTFLQSDAIFVQLEQKLCQKIVQLSCNFRFNAERHIDECMCFMPYGNGTWKIWFYYIRKVTKKDEIVTSDVKHFLEDEQKRNLNIISHELFRSNYEHNQDKFVLFPIDIEFVSMTSCKMLSIPIFNRLSLETESEYVLLLPTHAHKPDPATKRDMDDGMEDDMPGHIDFSKSLPSAIISCDGHILNILANGKLQHAASEYDIASHNRVTHDGSNTIFDNTISIDTETFDILAREIPHIQGNMSNKKPKIVYIDTSYYNEMGGASAVGGNLHCLVKTKY
jgi:protein involved in ribonucleotide reduction